MKKINLLFSCFFALLLWSGCGDDEIVTPATPEPEVNVGTTMTAPMGANLAQQVYVDLSTAEMTTAEVNTWEIAFENSGTAIRANSAKKVSVAVPTETDFASVASDEGLQYSFDSGDGDLSTTAFGTIQVDQPYIIDLGIDENGNTLGKKKFIVTAQNATGVSVEFADLDGSNNIAKTIEWDEGNFTFFSLLDDQKVTVEPADWDIVLTGVSVRTGAPCVALGPGAMPGINCDIYRLAAAALTNNYENVEVAKDDPFLDLEQNDDPAADKNLKTIDDGNFDELQKAHFTTLGASNAGDAIGRSWLQILAPHRNGIYKVYDYITYIVKDKDGNYYKVRFLAYKGGDNAENGYPTLEYELLTE